MKLTDLNVDCLLRIFKYLSEKDFRSLCCTNQLLNDVINENIYYAQSLDLLMCGHRNGPCIEEKNQYPLSHAERILIGKNWIKGHYREWAYFHHAQMFPTKLHLEHDSLFITHTAYLRKYRRGNVEPLERRYELEVATTTKSDISHFVKKRDTIFAGRVCGSCYVYEEDMITEQRMHLAKEYLYCLDFVDNLYVTSSDKCCKVWRRADEFGLIHFDLDMQYKSAFKSMRLSKDGQWLFGGLYTDASRRALRAIDIESGMESILNSNTISIYDLKMKDENVLFTANFDTTFRMYDRRSDCDVAVWEDPFDSSFYCLEYDGLYGVLCGTKYYSRVNLYDIRAPGKYIQLYFPSRSGQRNTGSPVYSIACDSRYLFVATDHNLRILDYKSNCATIKDYRNIFSEIRRI